MGQIKSTASVFLYAQMAIQRFLLFLYEGTLCLFYVFLKKLIFPMKKGKKYRAKESGERILRFDWDEKIEGRLTAI